MDDITYLDLRDDRESTQIYVDHDVLDYFNLTGNEFFVYATLIRLLNRDSKTAFPTLQTLAEKTRMSKPTAIKCIQALEEKHLIHVQREKASADRNAVNIYRILNVSTALQKYKADQPELFSNEEGGGGKNILPGVVKPFDRKKYTTTIDSAVADITHTVSSEQPEPPNKKAKIFSLWLESVSHEITPFIAESLNDLIHDYNADMVLDAIQEALSSAKTINLNYIKAILKRWDCEGRDALGMDDPIYRAVSNGFGITDENAKGGKSHAIALWLKGQIDRCNKEVVGFNRDNSTPEDISKFFQTCKDKGFTPSGNISKFADKWRELAQPQTIANDWLKKVNFI